MDRKSHIYEMIQENRSKGEITSMVIYDCGISTRIIGGILSL